MTSPSQTGSFWLCPECRKHVPGRVNVCKCGFDRERTGWRAEEVRIGRAAADPKPQRQRITASGIALAAGFAVLVGVSGYFGARAWLFPQQDTNKALVERFRKLSQPRVVVIEGPAPAPPAVSSVTQPPPSVDAVDGLPQEDQLAVPLPTVTTQPVARNPGDAALIRQTGLEDVESETDLRRRVGTEDFARTVASLSARADEADIAWHRYSEGCRLNVLGVTTRTAAVAGAGDREWFVVAGVASTSTVTLSQWTEACAEMGTFIARISHVHAGMCEAEDRARRSSILPGTRRGIRQRYRLEWWGWDHYCQSSR